MTSLALAIRFALREMRGGLKGFLIFITCIALGVAAIGGVNSVARAITAGVEAQGRDLLGGDIRFRLTQRQADVAEIAFLERQGQVATSATMRSMARLPDGSDQALVEIKAVDELYPLYGEFVTEPQMPLKAVFEERGGVAGAAVADILLERLGLHLGQQIAVGGEQFELRARIIEEPDLLSEGFAFAQRMMTSLEGLAAAGLVQEGSMVQYNYKLQLPEETQLEAVREDAVEHFPEAGWNIRDRTNAAPALSANVERFSQFLTLVGLTALVVGGVGVANAVRAHLDGKRGVIASLKSLGASGRFVLAVYLAQILLVAGIGIATGLVLALLMPFAAQWALSGVLPLPTTPGIYPGALALGAIFGVLVTLAFAIIPLGRARDVPATALFRQMGLEDRSWPRAIYVAFALAIAVAMAVIAISTAGERRIAVIFISAAIFAFIVLYAVGWLVQALARRSPPVRSTALRLAIGNIHRPGALTQSVVMALGLGLTLLVTLALIDGNLRREIAGNLPDQAPNFFFVDIQNDEVEDFSALLRAQAPDGELVRVPMLRGRVMALNGTDVRELEVPPEAAWVLRSDRGITYSADIPENSTVSNGNWWPADHAGEPLVSFAEEEGRELGLEIGDTITVNVLGRNITARIANFRQLQWESLGINFVMVFSPNSFAGAPHSWLATWTDPQAQTSDEARILNAVTSQFPTVTSVRVKDALDIVNTLIAQIAVAIRAAAALALFASVLVLSGALAAGNRARIHDAVVLKTLGATRKTLIRAFSLEYMLIGLATSVFALLAGGAAAWFVVARIMALPTAFLPQVAISTIVIALVLTVGIGLIGTWRVLGHRAAPVLRNL